MEWYAVKTVTASITLYMHQYIMISGMSWKKKTVYIQCYIFKETCIQKMHINAEKEVWIYTLYCLVANSKGC